MSIGKAPAHFKVSAERRGLVLILIKPPGEAKPVEAIVQFNVPKIQDPVWPRERKSGPDLSRD
jgi:hypothetical protein